MTFIETLRSLWFRSRVFIWYLLTEPFRQLKELLIGLVGILNILNKMTGWIYVIVLLLALSLFFNRRLIAGILVGLLLIVFLFWEWERGFFMFRYREKTILKAKKQKKEEEEDGHNSNTNNSG